MSIIISCLSLLQGVLQHHAIIIAFDSGAPIPEQL